ncbi:MAG: four helix bundle protein, partial [Atopobiaceae bacterium]|nr:four helix bundle protein [Atopobiaceae bacterium]
NYSLDVVEGLYRANLVYVRGSDDVGRMEERRELQRKAYVDLKTLAYLALLAKEQGCILGKQYEQISMQVADVLRLLVAWAKSDRRRYGGGG